MFNPVKWFKEKKEDIINDLKTENVSLRAELLEKNNDRRVLKLREEIQNLRECLSDTRTDALRDADHAEKNHRFELETLRAEQDVHVARLMAEKDTALDVEKAKAKATELRVMSEAEASISEAILEAKELLAEEITCLNDTISELSSELSDNKALLRSKDEVIAVLKAQLNEANKMTQYLATKVTAFDPKNVKFTTEVTNKGGAEVTIVK